MPLGDDARPAAASRIALPSRKAATQVPKLTVPLGSSASRTPMSNATNRPSAPSRSVSTSSSGIRKPLNRPSGSSSSSSSTPRSGLVAKRPAPAQALEAANGDEMQLVKEQMAAMAAMFDQERQNSAAQYVKDQAERKQTTEKMLQLEESLEEQKRLAKESKREVGRRRTLFDDEMAQLRQSHAREKRIWEEDLERERQTVKALKDSMAYGSTAHLTLEATNTALRTEVQRLQDELRAKEIELRDSLNIQQQCQQMADELQADLRDAETMRRKLHNEIQELRGNIRVFARIRPALSHQADSALATLRLPNPKEARALEVMTASESATGTATMRSFAFEFDRVFGPEAAQVDVFDEVQHLMQSVLDGYNTCIFAYGQTGSGKTHTLEGSGLPRANYDLDALSNTATTSAECSSAGAGLIPRAVQMLFATAQSLRDKGWSYDFEGSMVEIYNDNLNDLLGKARVDEGKHEIKHEKGRTVVTDVVVLPLRSPSQVFALLSRASSRRSVAATLMNERSSRSHSVFTLRVRGSNSTTLESCDATLSLVDLAGSERLATSGSGDDPKRLKEAVSINKSLSSLADVIQALGSGKAGSHVPYRNSTLTWLLKNSLGGNSKTLMLASISPMAEHLNESLSTLRFATKVNSTVIGTARKVKSAGE